MVDPSTSRSRLRFAVTTSGFVILAALWLGPLPELTRRSFTAHMLLHMGLVAVVAPLLAIGLQDGRFDPARRWPSLFSPVPAAVLELLVVWGWHAPALHHLARSDPRVLTLEQISFLGVGLVVWFSAVGGDSRLTAERSGAGAVGLLLTSMHMTLLGALLGLSTRSLYEHSGSPLWSLGPLQDQQMGGAVMLGLGGASYLAGGVVLVARLLRAGDHGGAWLARGSVE